MRIALIALPLALSACLEPSPPVVSAFNGNTVTIQTPGLFATEPPYEDDMALARATCGKPARYASGRMVGEYHVDKLFICG